MTGIISSAWVGARNGEALFRIFRIRTPSLADYDMERWQGSNGRSFGPDQGRGARRASRGTHTCTSSSLELDRFLVQIQRNMIFVQQRTKPVEKNKISSNIADGILYDT